MLTLKQSLILLILYIVLFNMPSIQLTSMVVDQQYKSEIFPICSIESSADVNGGYLPMSAFIVESTCPLSFEAYPQVLDQHTISLPVATYDSSSKKMVVHAVSSNKYYMSGFSFQGAFIGAAVAPNEYDELAVFAASDVVTYKGQEFGFRLSLKDNFLYGYVQDGKFFKNVRLMNGNKLQHVFEVYFENMGTICNFSWFVDGKMMGSYAYNLSISFNKYMYNIVCTTHRKEGEWCSKGLELIIGRILLAGSLAPIPFVYNHAYAFSLIKQD